MLALNGFNPFYVNVPFLYPLKRQQTRGFLTFTGGIEMEHWGEMS